MLSNDTLVSSSPNGIIYMWDVIGGDCLLTVQCHVERARNYHLVMLPGNMVACSFSDKIFIWKIK
jgi:hypothetical protein